MFTRGTAALCLAAAVVAIPAQAHATRITPCVSVGEFNDTYSGTKHGIEQRWGVVGLGEYRTTEGGRRLMAYRYTVCGWTVDDAWVQVWYQRKGHHSGMDAMMWQSPRAAGL